MLGKQQQLPCRNSYLNHRQILTPTDFLLWGFLTESVYSHNPSSLEDLQHNTEHTVAGNDKQTVRKDAKAL